MSLFPVFIYGQKSDSTEAKHFPRHYISINPINSVLLDQVGLAYEYKPGIFGFGLAAGYKYASQRNYSRLFIAGTTQHGPFEFYSGLYVIPQINVYFNKPKKPNKATFGYFSLKGVYKYLHVDSTDYHIWDSSDGDYYWLYRKQVDNANIIGVFWNLGIKIVRNHFFFDLNFGPGIIYRDQRMVVAGKSIRDSHFYHDNISNVVPPRKEDFSEHHFTINVSMYPYCHEHLFFRHDSADFCW